LGLDEIPPTILSNERALKEEHKIIKIIGFDKLL
jgi:hypothetical protein